MSDCIFCNIIKGNAQSSIVYQDSNVTAFMDLYPINKGHVLIVPNKHFERFTEVEEGYLSEMFKVSQRILKAIVLSDISCEGANLFLSDGEIAGQEVPHSHLHIAPRFTGDGHKMGFSNTNPDESSRERLDRAAEMIKEFL